MKRAKTGAVAPPRPPQPLFAGIPDISAYTLNPVEMVEGIDYGFSETSDGRFLWLDSHRNFSTSNGYPRAQLSSPKVIEPGNEYWVAYKFYLGEDQLVVPVEGGETQWMTIMSPAYGAPWGGSGPMTLALALRTQNGVFQNQNIIQMSGNSGILGPVVMPFGSWVQLLFHFKFDYEGWVELWWHRPVQGWQRLRIYNTDGPYPWATRKAGTNDTGTNYNNLGVYGTTSHRTKIMCHRISTTLYDVNYASDGWIPITL